MKSTPFLVCLPQIRQEGFFHAQDIPNSPNRGSSSFQQIVGAFMGQDALPFSDVLTKRTD